MRLSILSVTLLLAACASAPIAGRTDEIVGSYRKQNGPEIWEELDIRPDGLCTRASCSWNGFLSRTSDTGCWRIECDRLVIESSSASHMAPHQKRLTLRRWRGHVYLVPDADLEFFDKFGPDDEFCFVADGAPTAEPWREWTGATGVMTGSDR